MGRLEVLRAPSKSCREYMGFCIGSALGVGGVVSYAETKNGLLRSGTVRKPQK